jgi:ADP-ribosylglycohydrolase
VTHDHPEGVKGAESVAAAIFVARSGTSRSDVREVFEARFGYDCSTPLETLRARLPADMLEVTERFVQRYGVPVG